MSNLEHKPGSWKIDDTTVYALDETGRVNRFSAQIQGGYASYRDERTTPDELAAIARLISAAPDMLAALQNASGLLDTPLARRQFHGSDFYQEVVESIRAAISQAKSNGGEQQ